jgi:hypothetical protein
MILHEERCEIMEKEENDEGNIGVAEGVDVKSLTDNA